MDIISLLVLAVVQGLTEFLPVSSSAHLVLFGNLLGDGGEYLGIAIVLHGASLVAAVLYFRRDIFRLVSALFVRVPSAERTMGYALVLGTVPIAVVGFFVYPLFSTLGTVSVVAVALVVSGALLVLADHSVRKGWLTAMLPMWRKGTAIGLMQVFALLPGVSRSGITITAGRLVGFSRKDAVRFSFLARYSGYCWCVVAVMHADTSRWDFVWGLERCYVALWCRCYIHCCVYDNTLFFCGLLNDLGFCRFFCIRLF